MDAGARERLKTLVQDYGEPAFRFAYRLTRNIEVSRDLVSGAFARVLVRWQQYDSGRPFESWLFSILHHLFVDLAKRSERRTTFSLGDFAADGPDSSPTAGRPIPVEEGLLEQLERRECIESVRNALERLPWEFKSAVILRDMEGMRYGEIAAVIGCPIGTVRSRISRARMLLRIMLAGMLEEEAASAPAAEEVNDEMPRS